MKILRLARILLVVASIALALYAQSTISQGALGASTLPLFGVAIGLAVASSIGMPALPQPQPNAAVFEAIKWRHRIALGFSFALMVLGALEFLKGVGPEDSSPAGWIFYALSMVVFGLTFVPFGSVLGAGKTAAALPKNARLERVAALVLFVAVAGAALFVRLNMLSDFPDGVWFDEGANGLVSLKMIQDPSYRPLYVDVTQMPAHFNFIIAFLFQIFGVNIGAIRLAPTVFGVAAVAFTFLLFRRWFNTPIAVFAAAMFAVMRYSLTLSRFGVNGQTNAAFMVISLYFLDRAVRHKKLIDFALAGLVIGMGLNFYYAYRLYAGIVFGFGGLCVIIWLALRLFRRNVAQPPIGKTAKSWVAPVLVLLSGILVALAPVIQFAARNPEQFFIRTATVSIFEKRDEPDLAKALTSNITKHALMWNVRGDGNGRHNIPGEPMLDPVMGALAALGMGYALARAHRARNFLMLILFVGMLMGGILSVDFEAPQGYRSNGVMPSIIYFSALPLALLAQAVKQGIPQARFKQAGCLVAGLGGAVLLFNMAQFNLDAFFNRQRNSAATWIVQSPGETFAGREMKRLAADFDLVVSSQFANHPSQKFEAPNVTNFKIFTPNDLLVFGNGGGRGVAYLLDSSLKSTYQLLKKYFPTAKFIELTPPGGGDAVAYSVAISPDDIKQLVGVDVSGYDNDSFSGAPTAGQSLPALAADWTGGLPAELAGGAKAVEFRASLYVPQYGMYKFALRGAPNAEIYIDEFLVKADGMNLGRGNHALRVRLPSANTRAKFDLAWQPPGAAQLQTVPASALLRAPVSNNGLLGSYYRSPDWSGEPAFTQIDPEVAFYFHNLPLPRPYTVAWTGKVYAPQSGRYEFATMSIDESMLSVDGTEIVNNQNKGSPMSGGVELSAGWHDIAMRFGDRTGYTQAYLYWARPGSGREIIPSQYLLPPMGQYPSNAEMERLFAVAPKTPEVVRTSKSGETGGSALALFKVVLPPTPVPAPAAPPVAQPPVAPPGASQNAQPAANPVASNVAQLGLQPVLEVGKQGAGKAEFFNPRSIAIGKDGRVFVADTDNKRVQILDANGGFIGMMSETNEGVFSEPIDVLIGNDQNLIVLDADKPVLARFDQNGKFLNSVPLVGASMYKQRGFAQDAAGNFYVANTGGGQIVKFDANGNFVTMIGARGTAKGQLVEPNAVAVDKKGEIYAVDAQGQRVVVFGADGAFAREFSIPGASAAVGPRIVIGADGAAFITATEPHTIQQYSGAGELKAQYGGFGNTAGLFRQPTGIAQQGDVIWIVDTGNQRVQKLKLTR